LVAIPPPDARAPGLQFSTATVDLGSSFAPVGKEAATTVASEVAEQSAKTRKVPEMVP
jgi:hypothetical protein